jgi:hypothetical protein
MGGVPVATPRTPYDVICAVAGARRLAKPELLGVTRSLEARALADPPALALAFVQDVRFARPRVREVWRTLAAAGTRVTAYGRDLPAYVAAGVAGVNLDDADRLVDIWALLVVWPDGLAVGFAANDVRRDLDGAIPDHERDFDLTETADPALVRECLAELGLTAP